MLATKLKEETSVNEFRKQKQAVLNLRKVESDLKKSQLACEQLDVAAGIMTPNTPWFWRSDEANNDGDEEESEEEESMDVSRSCEGMCALQCKFKLRERERERERRVHIPPLQASDQLDLLTEYLRAVHFYCIWCGTAYDGKLK